MQVTGRAGYLTGEVDFNGLDANVLRTRSHDVEWRGTVAIGEAVAARTVWRVSGIPLSEKGEWRG